MKKDPKTPAPKLYIKVEKAPNNYRNQKQSHIGIVRNNTLIGKIRKYNDHWKTFVSYLKDQKNLDIWQTTSANHLLGKSSNLIIERLAKIKTLKHFITRGAKVQGETTIKILKIC